MSEFAGCAGGANGTLEQQQTQSTVAVTSKEGQAPTQLLEHQLEQMNDSNSSNSEFHHCSFNEAPCKQTRNYAILDISNQNQLPIGAVTPSKSNQSNQSNPANQANKSSIPITSIATHGKQISVSTSVSTAPYKDAHHPSSAFNSTSLVSHNAKSNKQKSNEDGDAYVVDIDYAKEKGSHVPESNISYETNIKLNSNVNSIQLPDNNVQICAVKSTSSFGSSGTTSTSASSGATPSEYVDSSVSRSSTHLCPSSDQGGSSSVSISSILSPRLVSHDGPIEVTTYSMPSFPTAISMESLSEPIDNDDPDSSLTNQTAINIDVDAPPATSSSRIDLKFPSSVEQTGESIGDELLIQSQSTPETEQSMLLESSAFAQHQQQQHERVLVQWANGWMRQQKGKGSLNGVTSISDVMLLKVLLESLFHIQSISFPPSNPKFQSSKENNLSFLFALMATHGVKLREITPKAIAKRDFKLCMELLVAVLHAATLKQLQATQAQTEPIATTLYEALLLFMNRLIYPTLQYTISDCWSSLQSGDALCVFVSELARVRCTYTMMSAVDRVKYAYGIAEQYLDISPIVPAEQVGNSSSDAEESSMINYLSMCCMSARVHCTNNGLIGIQDARALDCFNSSLSKSIEHDFKQSPEMETIEKLSDKLQQLQHQYVNVFTRRLPSTTDVDALVASSNSNPAAADRPTSSDPTVSTTVDDINETESKPVITSAAITSAASIHPPTPSPPSVPSASIGISIAEPSSFSTKRSSSDIPVPTTSSSVEYMRSLQKQLIESEQREKQYACELNSLRNTFHQLMSDYEHLKSITHTISSRCLPTDDPNNAHTSITTHATSTSSSSSSSSSTALSSLLYDSIVEQRSISDFVSILPSRKGWLFIRNPTATLFGKTWKKQFFILSGNTLYIADNQYTPLNKCSNKLDIARYSIIEPTTEAEADPETLNTYPLSTNRAYALPSDSDLQSGTGSSSSSSSSPNASYLSIDLDSSSVPPVPAAVSQTSSPVLTPRSRAEKQAIKTKRRSSFCIEQGIPMLQLIPFDSSTAPIELTACIESNRFSIVHEWMEAINLRIALLTYDKQQATSSTGSCASAAATLNRGGRQFCQFLCDRSATHLQIEQQFVDLFMLLKHFQQPLASRKQIGITFNNIACTDEAVQLLSHILSRHRKITCIDLSNNMLTCLSASYLATAFRNNTFPLTLILNNNELGDSGLFHLSSAIESNDVHLFSIRGNEITDRGVLALCSAIRNNTSDGKLRRFEILDLSCNSITDQAIIALAKCISQQLPIEQLFLSHNQLTDVGFLALCEAIAQNPYLTLLDVSFNCISSAALQSMVSMLQTRSLSVQINLTGNSACTVSGVQLNSLLQLHSLHLKDFTIECGANATHVQSSDSTEHVQTSN